MADRILVPIDGSAVARGALEFALSEFDPNEVVVLNVLETTEHVDDARSLVADAPQREAIEGEVEEWFEEARTVAADFETTISTAVETGKPDRAIVDYADANGIELIVMGTNGRTGASRILMGSVAENVVRRAPVPVLVYR